MDRWQISPMWLTLAAMVAGALITMVVTVPSVRAAALAVSTVVTAATSVGTLILARNGHGSRNMGSRRDEDEA